MRKGGHYMINSIMMERTATTATMQKGRNTHNYRYSCGFNTTRLCCLSDCGELEEFSTSGVFDI